MIFRQLFDAETFTYTYLIADAESKRGIIIDSVSERFDRDLKLIQELGIKLVYSLDTHVHADHITAAAKLRDATGCKIAYSSASKVECADELLGDEQILKIDGIQVKALATPGHTDCSMCFLVNNELILTGDALFIRGCGRTDFQQGCAATLYDNIHNKLFTLANSVKVYPGHDYQGMTMSTIGEEKNYNPRFVGKTKEEFIELMNNLNLPNPKRIDESVPANLKCGTTL